MTKFKLYFATILALFGVSVSQAQTPDNYTEMRVYLQSMFRMLNKNLVPTGFLLDYGIEYVDITDYDGVIQSDSTIVNMGIYRDILRTLDSASVRTSNFYAGIKPTLDNFETQGSDGNVTLSGTLFQYNMIKENALTDNLIYYDETNNIVRDVYTDGRWINPYDTKYVFAFVANMENCNSTTVSYTLPNNLFFHNVLGGELSFDAGDGLGYRILSLDTPVTAVYNSEGAKILRLRMRTKDGRCLETHTRINIDLDFTSSILGSSDCWSEEYTSSEFNGEAVTARVVYRVPRDGKFDKPFIVVEGFDPWQLLELYNKKPEYYPNAHTYAGYTHYCSYEAWFNELENTYHYDVVYIDWKNSEADIRANACLLQDIIKDINSLKSISGSSEKNVIFGLSMGGLIARYALRDMELNNELHEVSTYISGDTPHLGVNVPIGYQVFINQLLSFMHGYSDVVDIMSEAYDDVLSYEEKIIKHYLTSPAARQMMYGFAEGCEINYSVHNAWQEELNAMGFPQGDAGCKMELIALSNDSSYDYKYDLINGRNLLYLDGYVKSSAIVDLALMIYSVFWDFDAKYQNIESIYSMFCSNSINVDAEVNLFSAYNRENILSRLKVEYTKRFLWIGRAKTIVLFESEKKVPSSLLYYEDFPGSLYYLERQSDKNHTVCYDNWFGDVKLSLAYKTRFLFVPTASALNIYQSQNAVCCSDYQFDFGNVLFTPRIDIPFDAYHIDSSLNQSTSGSEHIQFSSNAYSWLINQINMEINGPDFVPLKNEDVNLDGVGQYLVSGLNDANAEINWYVSDESIATINRGTGELSAVSNGIVEVTARSNIGSKIYQKTKKVYVGFPDFVIQSEYKPGDGYKFTARLTNDRNIRLSEINETAGVYYRWYTINRDGECVQVDDSQIDGDSYSILPSQDEVITVVLRLEDDYGNCSCIRSITVNLMTPFETNYNYIVIDKQNNLHYVKNMMGLDYILPYVDFAISFRNIALNEFEDPSLGENIYLKGDMCHLNCRNVNEPYGVYTSGYKIDGELRWVFNLLDLSIFEEVLAEVYNTSYDERRVLAEYEIIIMNSLFEVMQRVPFKIIYNPDYSSVTPPVVQYED